MADRTSEGVRVCVRCGREGGLRDVRCAECGFDLTSDLQRDYDRYRSTTSGRGPSTVDALEGAQPRKKTAPNVHGALGRFTPAPGGQVLDAALDESRRDRAGRVPAVGSAPGVAVRTRGGGQRVLGGSAMRPPAPPPPPSRLTGTHAAGARRLQESEAKQRSESVADLLARHTPDDELPDGAGPRTTAWHPGSASDDAAVDPKLAPVGEGEPGDAPVTRAWGDVDEARERAAVVEARSREAVLAATVGLLGPAPGDPLAYRSTAASVAQDPAVAALAEAAAEAGAVRAEPEAAVGASAQPTSVQPEDATVSLRVEDFIDALASFGLSDDDDDDDDAEGEGRGAPGSGGFGDDESGGEGEGEGEGDSAPAGEPARDEATVMLQGVAEAPEERTVAMPAAVVAEEVAEVVEDDAPTVIAARPKAAEALLDPGSDDGDAPTVVAARGADGDDPADTVEEAGDAYDDAADTSESEAVEAEASASAAPERPGSRRKKRRRSGSGKGQAAATPAHAPAAAAAAAPAAGAEVTLAIAAVEPVRVAPAVSPVAQPAPANTRPRARAAEPTPSPPARAGSTASASAAPPAGDRAQSRPLAVASDAAMRAEALAPPRAFGARAVADPISQNLRPGTTTYVDATRKGFRRGRPAERDGSGVYVGVGVFLGLIVLAALLYFSR